MKSWSSRVSHSGLIRGGLVAAVVFAGGLIASSVSANHPVLVEGEQDFDGDGRLGVAEDNDGDNQVFGTITGGLGALNGGAAGNGRVTIVTSGRFQEIVKIINPPGNVTLEAAPGVEANIDAVLFMDPDNVAFQNSPGVIVDASNKSVITLRNLVSRNWTVGFQTLRNSRVIIDNCRAENNTDYGIRAQGSSRVTVTNSLITGNGFRLGQPGTDNTPNPGVGIAFEGNSKGAVSFSVVSSNFSTGIENETGARENVKLLHNTLLDNNRDTAGAFIIE